MSTIKVGQENSTAIELYYEDHGQGRPVVLIAGYPFDSTSWERQTATLVEAGYRAITYDRRGFGRSSRPASGYGFNTLAADLDALLTALDLREVSLVGYSMGTGEIARYIARYGTARVRRAVLIGTIGPYLLKTADNPEGVNPSVFEDLKAAIRQDRAAFLFSLIQNTFNFDEFGGTLVSERVIEQLWNNAVQASPFAALQSIDAWIEDFRQDLPCNEVPTLILHAGDRDRVLPPDATSRRHAKLLKNGRFVEFADAPHFIPWTHADRVNEELLAFLR
ncbi:MAG: alpha/beta hydrolase [Nevskia sp.]|nr:alpha/beta hydrolase [Nevskia sp.]